jgi:epoxyqueuosine reductase
MATENMTVGPHHLEIAAGLQEGIDGAADGIRAVASRSGADLVGIAYLQGLQGIVTHPPDLLDEYSHGISAAVRLEPKGSRDAGAEAMAFSLLDSIGISLAEFIDRAGYRYLIVPPDGRAGDRKPLSGIGAISHKAVAKVAGLGWIGKSTLLITPRFGPRVCLITVLTNMPLPPDMPCEERCAACRKCIDACPAGALAEADLGADPYSRGVLNAALCGSFHESLGRGGEVCYECILVCPWGRPGDRPGPIPGKIASRLHNAWIARQDGCLTQGHTNPRPRVLSYGSHIQVVKLCDSCFRTGKREHRQLARRLAGGQ